MPILSTHQVKPTPPYNFGAVLAVYGRFQHPTLDVIVGDTYRRVLRVGGKLTLAEVLQTGTIDQPALTVNLHGNDDISADQVGVQLNHILSFDQAHAEFWVMAQANPILWSIIEPVYGMPTLKSATIFEALVDVIIEQHIAWTAAQRAQRWLVEWGGHCVEYDGQTYYAQPEPTQLATASLEELKPLKITHGRINLLIQIARDMVEGRLDLESLANLPSAEAYQELLKIKGVGHWTATVTLARALGYYGYLPHNDVAVQAAVNHYFYQLTGRSTADVLRSTFEQFGEFAGLAAHYTLMRWVLDKY